MKKSLKIALSTALCAVFALTLTFCGSKSAENQAETQDVPAVEADTTQVEADTTEVAADTTSVQ